MADALVFNCHCKYIYAHVQTAFVNTTYLYTHAWLETGATTTLEFMLKSILVEDVGGCEKRKTVNSTRSCETERNYITPAGLPGEGVSSEGA